MSPRAAPWLGGLGYVARSVARSAGVDVRGGPSAPAAILALSGFIPTVEGFDVDLRDRAGLPVAIGHGTQDPVISVDFARDAHRRLERAGLAVLYRESPLPHTIDPHFVAVLQNWIRDATTARTGHA
jgi:phospholipase/carboxylesterase